MLAFGKVDVTFFPAVYTCEYEGVVTRNLRVIYYAITHYYSKYYTDLSPVLPEMELLKWS